MLRERVAANPAYLVFPAYMYPDPLPMALGRRLLFGSPAPLGG